MKQELTLVALAGLCLLAGCKEKKQTQDIIAPKIEAPKPQGPISMQSYSDTVAVDWLGKEYKVEVCRAACDSLPMVKDETGQKFVDNRISLRVLRSDGSVFYQGGFTKAAFENCLDNDYRKTGIVEGFVFDKVDGAHLVFAASVCHPQTDEYIPLVVTLSSTGEVGIRRDSDLDTFGNEEEDNDD